MAAFMAQAREPWWVIGSAAVALHGADPGPVADVDVLLGTDDAATLLARLGLPVRSGEPDARFRSAVFARWTAPPLPVEFMAGLDVRDAAGWIAVRPDSRILRRGAYVPKRAELRAILQRFGRDKDLRRAAVLDQSAGRSIDQKRGPSPGTRHSSVTAKPSP